MTAVLSMPVTLPAGEVVATGVSLEDYMAHYAETFHEWVKGAVIKMSPVSLQHTLLTKYLLYLLDAYFEINPIGRALHAPFVMRLEAAESSREPDLQVILKTNPGQLTATAMIGPADLCIEVISPESVARDYGEKFEEYEKAGVREYWIIDPLRQETSFHRLQDTGLYARAHLDPQDTYRTPLLPGLALHIPTLWADPLPGVLATAQAVQAMLKAE
jgi:Uma2 family endonuclease